MKILYVGPDYGGSSDSFKVGTGQFHMVKGLRNNGHEVSVFKYGDYSTASVNGIKTSFYRFLPNNLCDLALRGFLYKYVPFEVVLDWHGYKSQNERLLRTVSLCRPDVLLISYGLFILPSTLKILKKTTPVVLLYGMSPTYWSTKHEKSCFPLYDLIIANGPDRAKEFERYGNSAVYLPLSACDPNVHRTIQLSDDERKKFGTDVCFVGALYPDRLKTFMCLTKYDFGLWAPEFIPSAGDRLRKCYKGKAFLDEFLKIYSASKITLNTFGPGDEFGVNMRLFESPACGIMQIAEEKPGISSFYRIGEEIVCYKDPDELVELVSYYLKNPDKIRSIAINGQKRAHKDHTYEKRMASLITILKGKNII